MRNGYATTIEESLARQRLGAIDPRHIEGWMRCEHSTLDGLSHAEFDRQVRIAAAAANADPILSEQVAQSYGLFPLAERRMA